MRDSSNGHTAPGAARHQPNAAEQESLASPPPPLYYSDESPDTLRHEPHGRRSLVGSIADTVDQVRPGNIAERLRSRLLGRLQRKVSDTGEWLGQMLGEFIEVATVFEQDTDALREHVEDRLATLTTGASHAEQLQAGALGGRLEDLRDQEPQGHLRRTVIVKAPAVAALAAVVALAAGAAIWLLWTRRSFARKQAQDEAVVATTEVWEVVPLAAMPDGRD